jgi:hypothetical protein
MLFSWSTLSLLSIFYTVTISSNILFGYSFFFEFDHRTFLRFHFCRLFNSTTVVFLTFYRFLVSRLVAFFCLLSDFCNFLKSLIRFFCLLQKFFLHTSFFLYFIIIFKKVTTRFALFTFLFANSAFRVIFSV